MKQSVESDVVSSELEELLPDLLRFSRSLSGNSELAQDIAQESMTRALQRDEGLQGIVNLRGWLCQIAVNVFREWWRKNSKEMEHLRRLATNTNVSSADLPEGTIEQREHLESIWIFIKTLPDVQRQIIQLHLVDGCPHREIAKRLNITTDNVKSNLSLVRRKLRKKFLDAED